MRKRRKKDKVKRLIFKKKEASSTYLTVWVSVMAVFILIMLNVNTATNINRFRIVNQIGREYLLRMESDGYLTPEDRTDLETELDALGYVNNITISAPLSEVAYGQQITLKIQYDIELKDMNFVDIFNSSSADSVKQKTFNQSTTAKH